MSNNNTIFFIGGIGLLLYALSTADWSKVANSLNTIGKVLLGGAILWALSRMQ